MGQNQEQKRGGNKAVLFVYGMEGLENMAFVANAVSLVLYFIGFMNFNITKSATTVTNLMGASFLLPLLGGFISDTYLSRFKTCVLFGCIEVLGFAMLTVQAHFHELRPAQCDPVRLQLNQCEPATSGHNAMLFTGLYLLAIGTGGIKAALPALGADQFDSNDPKEVAKQSSFFNWFLLSLVTGSIIGVTFIIWISENKGWDWSFGLSTIAVFFAVGFVYMGKSFYRNNVPGASPLLRILQVFVAAFRNRNLPLPSKAEELHEIDDKEIGEQNEILQRTDQFRFLDRAAIPKTSLEESTIVMTPRPWNLTTVTQVEEAKILVRMLPIIVSTIFMNTCLAQLQTFSITQAVTTNTNIGSFTMPSASLPVIPLVFMFVFIPIYDRIFVPIARKITGIPTGIRHLQRIGIGLVLSAISMAVAGIVEKKRKNVAFEHNMVDSVLPLPMSVFWLGYQYAIFGLADMFTLVGLLEFFYAESPARMKALSTAISWSSFGFGYFLSTVVVEVVNKVSGGWLANNNLNRDQLDYFYYLLCGLSLVNFVFYLGCASWYKNKKVEVGKLGNGDEVDEIGKP